MDPGGCCADALLQRHVLEQEPGEGLQPAGPSSCLRLAQRRPVSTCMAMANDAGRAHSPRPNLQAEDLAVHGNAAGWDLRGTQVRGEELPRPYGGAKDQLESAEVTHSLPWELAIRNLQLRYFIKKNDKLALNYVPSSPTGEVLTLRTLLPASTHTGTHSSVSIHSSIHTSISSHSSIHTSTHCSTRTSISSHSSTSTHNSISSHSSTSTHSRIRTHFSTSPYSSIYSSASIHSSTHSSTNAYSSTHSSASTHSSSHTSTSASIHSSTHSSASTRSSTHTSTSASTHSSASIHSVTHTNTSTSQPLG
ncbi:hypothetical protein AAES_02352 [Amazona aestiva]|uniref:Uncharacterized protein n=1 Tax=Amazona aestiva TaxID=12930 RepID=A0A0Q3XAE1_AMAAE|nr:hypothetical protein AAES_02352 [Amazona aestiva]